MSDTRPQTNSSTSEECNFSSSTKEQLLYYILVFDGATHHDIHFESLCKVTVGSVNPKGTNLSPLTTALTQPTSSMVVNNAGRDGISKCLKSIKLSLMDGFIVSYKSGLRVGPEPAHLNEVKFIFMNSRNHRSVFLLSVLNIFYKGLMGYFILCLVTYTLRIRYTGCVHCTWNRWCAEMVMQEELCFELLQ